MLLDIGSTSMYEWTCSPFDSASDRYYLPDNRDTSNIFQFTWQDSAYGVSYVYPINENKLNCTGLVTALEFCYTTAIPPNNPNSTNAFQFLTLTRKHNNTFEVTKSIQVTATPSEARCVNTTHIHQCCEIMKFHLQDQFTIATNNLAIGFVPQNSTIKLQGWHASLYLNYTASSYKLVSSRVLGNNITELGDQGNNSLRIFWLHIGKLT